MTKSLRELEAIKACAAYLESRGWTCMVGGFSGIEQAELKFNYRLIFKFTGGKRKQKVNEQERKRSEKRVVSSASRLERQKSAKKCQSVVWVLLLALCVFVPLGRASIGSPLSNPTSLLGLKDQPRPFNTDESITLRPNSLQGTKRIQDAKPSDQYQQQSENIGSGGATEKSFQEFVVGMLYAAAFGIIVAGAALCTFPSNGILRGIGWVIFCLGIGLAFVAFASGSLGCLPWNWGRCLQERCTQATQG